MEDRRMSSSIHRPVFPLNETQKGCTNSTRLPSPTYSSNSYERMSIPPPSSLINSNSLPGIPKPIYLFCTFVGSYASGGGGPGGGAYVVEEAAGGGEVGGAYWA